MLSGWRPFARVKGGKGRSCRYAPRPVNPAHTRIPGHALSRGQIAIFFRRRDSNERSLRLRSIGYSNELWVCPSSCLKYSSILK